MTKECKDFLNTIKERINSGEIKLTKPLSDFDIAMQFVVGKIGETKGYPCNITYDEIYEGLNKHCPELLLK